MANPPKLSKPIPDQIVNEGASYKLNLAEFILSDAESGTLKFTAELANGNPFPKGLICTENGLLSGIPAAGTQGEYPIVVFAENATGIPFKAEFKLTIKSRISMEAVEAFGELKARVWEALGKGLPLPEIGSVFDRPITPIEVYYLLQRFATLTIWDVYNLDPPSEKQLITLEKKCSKHFQVWDRGSCIVAAPIDLFSHERNLEDAMQTARAVAHEVYKRGWVIEFAGFDKMVRAAWIELQLIGDRHGKQLEILHYQPSPEDMKIYSVRSQAPGLQL